MKSQETIKLYLYVDGVNDVPFYGDVSGVYEDFILANGEVFTTSNGFVFNVRHSNEQIEIGAFRYDAKRMGGAPTISFTLMFEDCLDNFWSNKVYAVFNDEKYFLKQIPTSSLSNEDARYKHTVELISERAILDNVYFFDAVVGNPLESDKAVSDSTKVVFFGSVQEFAKRLNASLEYTKLLKWEDGFNEDGEPIKIANGYNVVVDEGIGSEEKLMSFEDQFFSNVLQDIYNTYDVPYYFVGKTIHIGFSDDVYPHTFSYGVDDALISITKNNANYKVVNRVTGKGSTDNIPFYYPNDSPKGEIEVFASGSLTTEDIKILDRDDFTQLHVDKTYSFFGDSSASSESLKAVVPSQSVEVEFVDDNATLNKVYIEDGKSVDLQIRYDTNFESYANSKVELSWQLANYLNPPISMAYTPTAWGKDHLELEVKRVVMTQGDETYEIPFEAITEKHTYYSYIYSRPNQADTGNQTQKLVQTGIKFETPNLRGVASIVIEAKFKTLGNFWSCVPDYYWGEDSKKKPYSDIVFESSIFTVTTGGWKDEDGESVNMNNFGIQFLKDPQYGDTLGYHIVKYVNTSQNLMPSVYRHSAGKERFYNAINYPYPKYEGFDETFEEGYYGEDGIKRNALGEYEIDGMIHNDAYKGADGEYIVFKNPYFEGTPKEHAISVEDLKPTIKEAVNSMGLRMDMFSEFAYDLDDNDETEENEDGTDRDFIHSYFFGKLRKLDFNLFEHAIEQQPMTISFTSGNCGACNFEIGVTEEFPQKNPVLVNADGSLKRDEKGRVICGQFQEITEDEIQDEQQDTSKNEVWIALKKEESTYGILMPKVPIDGVGGHRPKACTVNEDGTANNDGDTFVILGINLPDSYISNAEDKLRDEIIKYIKENNVEKFNFSITFSRIYFAENPNVLQFLNENSRINIEYNGKIYTLYVTSYSYNMGEGDVLPEIRVELDDKLTLSQNSLQNAINEVKSEVGMAFANFDVLAFASPYFLRKDTDDICNGKIDFKKGIKFGEGGKVEVLDNNSAKLTIEYLEVTKKASFTSLEIKEKTHVGGQIIISPAAMTCGEVEELEDSYRCYFQTKNAEGNDEIFNQFAENDLAICQTYNAWGSRYYWRKVVGVGEDYIDLSKTLCDEYSDVPMIGDKIIQLGNTVDITRQSAIVLSAYGDNAPSFIMYNGINDFTLVDKNITGVIWNPKTLEPQMYSYGSFFFGDGTTDENGNLVGEDFITFQKRDGDTKKKLHINATVNFSSDSTGLSNLEEWKEVQTEISGINKTIEQVQDQIDGVVENHFYQGEPSLTSLPTSLWTTDEQKINHIGDTYTDIEEFVDSATTPNAGKSWRWCRCDDMVGIEDYVEVTDKDGQVYKLHWHPIADTDAVKALLKVYELEKKVADADYLKDTFKKGETNISGGVVMTEMVAVGEGGDNIEAFLNGSDFARIPNHYGKLILASGIPDTTASGSTDLAERAKEARTRLYENGVFDSDYSYIDAGFLGQFYADKKKLKTNSTYDSQNVSMLVLPTATSTDSPCGLGFRNLDSTDGVDTKVSISSKTNQTRYDLVDADKKVSGNMIVQFRHGLSSEVESSGSTKYDYLSAFYVSCKGTRAHEHFSIYCPAGQFAGLRPRYRRITTGGELSKLDHTIECLRTDGATIALTLPANPEVGQCYEIWKWGTCVVSINGNGKDIIRVGVSELASQGVGTEWVGMIKLVFRGTATGVNNWLMMLHRTE